MQIHLEEKSLKAGLYIIATPIGNLKDISLNALEALMAVDIIFCEDTRVSKKLLSAYNIQKPLKALHDHNEEQKQEYIAELIASGQAVALISDAGTPLISDPGYKLVQHLTSQQLYVTHLPGPSSITTALVLSALPSDCFTFVGFIPAKKQAKQTFLQELKDKTETLIMLESPHRILDTLHEMSLILGANRQVSLCRELTKRYEEVLHMPLGELHEYAKAQDGFKGEITLVVAPAIVDNEIEHDIDALLIKALETYRIKDAAHIVAEATGVSKKTLYQRALKIKDE
ncbi:MAG: 16S rRNA (cytidine(1402)-2'-O)-methyltransferase [Alphaproteobacteria bacterium]